MREVAHSFKTGVIFFQEVPEPALRHGCALVRNESSVVSAGAEKSNIDLGHLGKAQIRPELLRQVKNKVRTWGLGPTLDSARSGMMVSRSRTFLDHLFFARLHPRWSTGSSSVLGTRWSLVVRSVPFLKWYGTCSAVGRVWTKLRAPRSRPRSRLSLLAPGLRECCKRRSGRPRQYAPGSVTRVTAD